jgi:hypothetical protein
MMNMGIGLRQVTARMAVSACDLRQPNALRSEPYCGMPQ